MKPSRLLVVALLGTSLAAQAGIFPTGTINAAIPDANATGWSTTFNVTGEQPSITDVSVKLDITGGYNGDLYAYVSFGGHLVPLLTRVGVTDSSAFGFKTSGMKVTLADSGLQNIHDVATPGTTFDTYKPDGRTLTPLFAPGAFATDSTFAAFDGLNPNGLWTLFVADLSGGAISTLVSADLEITAVPEPVNVAMGIFGGLFGAGLLWKRFKARQA